MEELDNFLPEGEYDKFTMEIERYFPRGVQYGWNVLSDEHREFFKPFLDELDDIPVYIKRKSGRKTNKLSRCAVFSIEITTNLIDEEGRFVIRPNMLMIFPGRCLFQLTDITLMKEERKR